MGVSKKWERRATWNRYVGRWWKRNLDGEKDREWGQKKKDLAPLYTQLSFGNPLPRNGLFGDNLCPNRGSPSSIKVPWWNFASASANYVSPGLVNVCGGLYQVSNLSIILHSARRYASVVEHGTFQGCSRYLGLLLKWLLTQPDPLLLGERIRWHSSCWTSSWKRLEIREGFGQILSGDSEFWVVELSPGVWSADIHRSMPQI